MSYELKIDPRKRAAGRFIGKVRKALISAAVDEKKSSGLTQQQVASAIGVNKSVINRLLRGNANLTLRSVAEIAWAMGWDPDFTLKKRVQGEKANVDTPKPILAGKVTTSLNKYNVNIQPGKNITSTTASSKEAA